MRERAGPSHGRLVRPLFTLTAGNPLGIGLPQETPHPWTQFPAVSQGEGAGSKEGGRKMKLMNGTEVGMWE